MMRGQAKFWKVYVHNFWRELSCGLNEQGWTLLAVDGSAPLTMTVVYARARWVLFKRGRSNEEGVGLSGSVAVFPSSEFADKRQILSPPCQEESLKDFKELIVVFCLRRAAYDWVRIK